MPVPGKYPATLMLDLISTLAGEHVPTSALATNLWSAGARMMLAQLKGRQV